MFSVCLFVCFDVFDVGFDVFAPHRRPRGAMAFDDSRRYDEVKA